MSDRRSQAAVLFVVGAMALFLGRGDAALAYVKAGLQPLLVASGAILVGLAVVAVARHGQDRDGAGGPAGGHGSQPHGPRVAWLLVLPPLALVLIAPPALGAFAASRQSTQPPRTGPTGPGGQPAASVDPALFPPLVPPGDGAAVPMTISEYLLRDDLEPGSLAGVRIRLVGFVTPQDAGREGYLLTRFAINCCAADGTALRVSIHGDPVPRAPDTWLEIEGDRRQGTATPSLVALSVRVVEQPSQPYESGIPF